MWISQMNFMCMNKVLWQNKRRISAKNVRVSITILNSMSAGIDCFTLLLSPLFIR